MGVPESASSSFPTAGRRARWKRCASSPLPKLRAAIASSGYLACLQAEGALESGNRDKSFAHAWLASRRDPVARVGEGAQQGVWKFDHRAFAPLVRFIERLTTINS